MKKIYGAAGSYPEYYIVKNIQNASVITPSSKRAKLFFHDASVYKDYLKKQLRICYLPSEKDPLDIDSQIKRNFAVYNLLYSKNTIIVMDKDALDVHIRDIKTFKRDTLSIETGREIDRDYLVELLLRNGFIREEYPENEGEFCIKGGLVSIFIPFTGVVDLDFFGDTVENIFLKSLLGTRKKIEKIDIFPLYDFPVKNGDRFDLEFDKQKGQSISSYIDSTFKIYIDIHNKNDGDLYLFSAGTNPEIATDKEAENFETVKLPLRQPLVLKSEKKFFLSEKEKTVDFEFDPLKEGDYIIHEDYGIGIFRGIETRNIKGKTYDFMILEYADGEKIYVSYLHFGKIFKYKSSGIVKLDKIGGTSWRNLKKKVKNSLKKVAKELIKLYTERNRITRPPLDVNDELVKQFENSFAYVETPDQLKAIMDIKKDLSSDKPMERVVCGDVGFGKTEVALRAVFITALNGKQVAVLSPTTVLAYQHYRNFKERLEPFGIKVENLSRLKSKKEIDNILKEIKEGKIDVVVGTHRILQDDVKFRNLGLLVIDEEHRFGVRAKEKIRQIKKDVDTLYLTATPIPRTLNMALSGLKDLSVIKTPPEGRIETKTFVSVYNEEIIKKAISFELRRGGQVFYLHNRIETIQEKARFLKEIFPEVSVSVAHGKMKPKQIEKVILDFIQKKTDILVSTSIIETGIDIPTANTLIVERADLFGLAQLYHLRGRVGRGNIQAYCYLLVPPEITKDARKRLDAVLRLTRPGSGLKISIEDMQIRGAGNILGVEQSGHIKAVGYDFYIKLLQDVLNEETGKKEKEPVIQVNFEAYIPEDFISDSSERLNLYMIVSKAVDTDEIQQIKEYLSDFYSGIPEILNLYLEVEKLKRAVKGKGVSKIELGEPVTHIFVDVENPPEPEIIDKLINGFKISSISPDRISIFLNKKDISRLTEIFLSSIEKFGAKTFSN